MPCCGRWRGRPMRTFEVVVADDGSKAATAELIEAWKAKIGHRVEHVWHEDQGFRAAEIRNRAILASRGAYCIFLDGDCIVRPDFVAIHRRLAEPGWFVTGNRILLSRELTAKVLREKISPETWSLRGWSLNVAWRRQSSVGAAVAAAWTFAPAAPAAPGAARAHAIWPSGDPISIAWMASMQTIAAGARKTPISSCACCTPACAARTGISPPASSIFGMPRPIVHGCPTMNASSPASSPATGSARDAA